jgi:short-subunit dehydrogenase
MADYIHHVQSMLTLFDVTERIAILGASRGIGAALTKILSKDFPNLLLVSRHWRSEPVQTSEQRISLDLTVDENWEDLIKILSDFAPTRIFYVAGGGPHGAFQDKEFKDHEWAIKLNLITPAKLLHWALKKSTVTQIIFFGSAIAESRADPKASSYAAAKHGLAGLIKSVVAEQSRTDLRLYSPGYTSTDLLPKNAQAQLSKTNVVLSASDVAQDFVNWAFQSKAEFHRTFIA